MTLDSVFLKLNRVNRRILINTDKQVLSHSNSYNNFFWLSLGALGVVFGVIGTSPRYALRECFAPEHGVSVSQ